MGMIRSLAPWSYAYLGSSRSSSHVMASPGFDTESQLWGPLGVTGKPSCRLSDGKPDGPGRGFGVLYVSISRSMFCFLATLAVSPSVLFSMSTFLGPSMISSLVFTFWVRISPLLVDTKFPTLSVTPYILLEVGSRSHLSGMSVCSGLR